MCVRALGLPLGSTEDWSAHCVSVSVSTYVVEDKAGNEVSESS